MSLSLRWLHRRSPAAGAGGDATASTLPSGESDLEAAAETGAIAVPSRSRRLGLPPLLLRWKLTIFYSAVLALMLSTFSILVYWYMSRSMLADIDRNSERHADTAETALRNLVNLEQLVMSGAPGQLSLAPEIQTRLSLEKVLADSRYEGMAVRIYAGGQWLFATDTYVRDTSKVPFDSAILLSMRLGQEHRVNLQTSDTGIPLRSFSRPFFLGKRPFAVVEVLTSLQGYNQTRERLARLLLLGTLLATAVAFFIGAAVAEAALKPIDAVTRTAQQIVSRRDLARRIDDSGPQDEMGRLISTFNAMLQQIQGMFDRQQRFLADVSHELRTPLTTIRGEADLMTRSGRLDAEGLNGILSESERMSRLVEDLLLLARNDAAAELEKRPVELAELLQEVARQAGVLGGDSHSLSLGTVDAARVAGDRDRLKQLLLNLVSNALRHTPPGTAVTLGLRAAGDEAILTVADTGQGIDPADLPYLFDRFYKADKARKRQGVRDSTGLGLAIVQSIAQAHGGWVAVDSALFRGTTFTVHLPLAAVGAPDTATTVAGEAPPASRPAAAIAPRPATPTL
ncbi:MAG: HAMP domain-containing protein [Ardenticatenia bacterium]|nr:HAMP domain-containing protein [Ardenticatenia bacterium]